MKRFVPRDTLFATLRKAMLDFARFRKLGDFEAVASDMKMWGESSWDPIYKVEFDQLFSDDCYEVSVAMRLAAQFTRTALGDRIVGSREFAEALERASEDESLTPDFLMPFRSF